MTTAESKLEWTPYKRVFQIAKRPNTDEFLQVAGITGGGAVVIGLLGSLIYAAVMLGGAPAMGVLSLAIILALVLLLP